MIGRFVNECDTFSGGSRLTPASRGARVPTWLDPVLSRVLTRAKEVTEGNTLGLCTIHFEFTELCPHNGFTWSDQSPPAGAGTQSG